MVHALIKYMDFQGIDDLIDPNAIVWNYYRDRPFVEEQRYEAAHYYNAVKRLDIGVGMILATLDNAGISDNTLVIFASDHNGSPGSIQGGKADIRDASNRVPLLIRFPAGRRQPLVYDGLVSLIDLFPTILEAAGNIPIPEPTSSLMTDARSLMPLISSSTNTYQPRSAIYTEMTYHGETLYRPSRSIRTRDWHLIKYYPPFERGTDFVQLFDLRNDPLEYSDLSGDPAYNGTKEILLDWLSEWQRETRGIVETPGKAINISTRGQIEASNAMHGGFVIRDAAKTVLVKGLGPTLADRGLTGTMSDPVLTLYRGQQVVAESDDWMVTGECGNAELAPDYDREPCVMRTLQPGAYTAVVRGAGGSTGKAIVSVNDMGGDGEIINLSTRGRVVPGVDGLTGGFVIRERNVDVLVKALGPTLGDRGVAETLSDPKLALYFGQSLIATNDDWQRASCAASGMEPDYAVEPCIRATLGPGVYTAIVTSADGSAGTAIVSINTIQD